MRSGTRPEEITQAEAVVQQKEEALSRSEAGPRSEDIDEAQAQMTSAQGAM
jgi:HlyD family secretion protein